MARAQRAAMRLDQYLSKSGHGSRKQVRNLLAAGRVLVDGRAVRDPATRIDPGNAAVILDDKPVLYREFLFVMLNKPTGVVTATRDGKYRTVLDLLPEEYRVHGLFPAGRLDRDSEGLVLLTNDGQLAHALTAPGKGIPKVYNVRLESPVTVGQMEAFASGIVLDDGYRTKPAELTVPDSRDPLLARVVLSEGKYRQIRRMCRAAGNRVLQLKRLKIGNLTLDPRLEPGSCRELNEKEEAGLRRDASVSRQSRSTGIHPPGGRTEVL